MTTARSAWLGKTRQDCRSKGDGCLAALKMVMLFNDDCESSNAKAKAKETGPDKNHEGYIEQLRAHCNQLAKEKASGIC